MANNVVKNPAVIDTFGSDVVVDPETITVTSIVVEDSTIGDTATFIDADGTEVLRLSINVANSSVIWSPAEPFTFTNGLTFDDSASSFAAGAFIFIFKK